VTGLNEYMRTMAFGALRALKRSTMMTTGLVFVILAVIDEEKVKIIVNSSSFYFERNASLFKFLLTFLLNLLK